MPHRSAPVKLRLTALGRGPPRTPPGGASVYHRPCHTSVTNYADATGPQSPDLLQRTHRGLAWTPIDGLYNLCHVVPHTKPRDRKDPDHTRTNRAATATSYAITAVQGLASAVPPADEEPAGPSADAAEHDCLTPKFPAPCLVSFPIWPADQRRKVPDTPSERASNERHERHSSVKISPVTPTPHIMRTGKVAGQDPFATGSRIATHSTWCVIGNRSNTRSVRTRYPPSRKYARSRARAAGSQAT